MSTPDIPREILSRFRQLAAERLTRAESIWFALLQGTGESRDAAELHRLLHTLKGDARLVRLSDVDLVCHKLEDLLAVAKDLAYAVPDDVDLLVTMSFHFIGLLARQPAGASMPGIDLEGFVQEVDQAVRAARTIDRRTVTGPEDQEATPREAGPADQRARLARAATMAFLEHIGARGESRERLHRLWRLLRQEVAQLSSTPLERVVQRHVVSVQDLCGQLGKRAEIRTDTGDLCVTSRVADALDVAFVHCIRNAVDHGLEPPDERVTAGKPPGGVIRIGARMDGDVIEVVVEDDGRGFDREVIERRALDAGLLSEPERRRAPAANVRDLLFLPGFSTAAGPSSVSGRGVGLDAVRSALSTVGGEVSADDRLGGGARIVMRVPSTLHHMHVHVFEARPGIRLAVPTSWALIPDSEGRRSRIDPLEALGMVAPSASPPEHTVLLRWGLLQACYASLTSPRSMRARRVCPTTSTDPMEVVTVEGDEVLVLRPDQISGAAGARVSEDRAS